MLDHLALSRSKRLITLSAFSVAGIVAAVVLFDRSGWPAAALVLATTAILVVTVKAVFGLVIEARRHRTDLRRAVAEAETMRSTLNGRLDRLQSTVEAQVSRLTATNKLLNEIRQGLTDTRSEADTERARLTATNKLLNEIRQGLKDTRQGLKDARSEADTERARLTATNKLLNEIRQGLKDTRSDIAQRHASALQQLASLRGEGFQQFSRHLGADDCERIASEWGGRLGVEVPSRRVAYLAARLVEIESRCRGRIATAAEDAVIRALVASALDRDEVRVAEIGVLFAVNAAYLHDVAAPFYRRYQQVLIDPFFGYYGGDEPDPFTGIPVTEGVARQNLARCHVPVGSYDLIVGLSEHEDVRRQAGGDFDLVLIDGDHSYDVVAADFSWSADHVVGGGYVIFDDYRGPTWPDVTRFVDEVAAQDARFENVGWGARTAVFRRRPA